MSTRISSPARRIPQDATIDTYADRTVWITLGSGERLPLRDFIDRDQREFIAARECGKPVDGGVGPCILPLDHEDICRRATLLSEL